MPLSLLLLAVALPLMVLAILAARRLHRSRLANIVPTVEVSAEGGEKSAREAQETAEPIRSGTEQPSHTAAIERNLLELAHTMRSLSTLTTDLYEKRRTLADNVVEGAHEAESREAMASRHYLTFTLGEERFAINMMHVSGALEATQLIADPALPAKIRRAIKLEGSLVPVIDLGARLARQPVDIGWNTRILLLELPRNGIQQTIGVLVDSVGRIVEIDPANIESPPTSGAHRHDEFVLGLGRADDLLLPLLDIEHVLSAGRLALPTMGRRVTHQEHWPT